MKDEKSLSEKIVSVEGRLNATENLLEEFFYSLLSLRTDRKSIELIIELAVIEQFGITRKDFHELNTGGFGKAILPDNVKMTILARKWFMGFMYNHLHHTSYSMSKNYSFYNFKKELEFRSTFLAAREPKSEVDKRNRLIYLSISSIIKSTCRDEKIFHEILDDLP